MESCNHNSNLDQDDKESLAVLMNGFKNKPKDDFDHFEDPKPLNIDTENLKKNVESELQNMAMKSLLKGLLGILDRILENLDSKNDTKQNILLSELIKQNNLYMFGGFSDQIANLAFETFLGKKDYDSILNSEIGNMIKNVVIWGKANQEILDSLKEEGMCFKYKDSHNEVDLTKHNIYYLCYKSKYIDELESKQTDDSENCGQYNTMLIPEIELLDKIYSTEPTINSQFDKFYHFYDLMSKSGFKALFHHDCQEMFYNLIEITMLDILVFIQTGLKKGYKLYINQEFKYEPKSETETGLESKSESETKSEPKSESEIESSLESKSDYEKCIGPMLFMLYLGPKMYQNMLDSKIGFKFKVPVYWGVANEQIANLYRKNDDWYRYKDTNEEVSTKSEVFYYIFYQENFQNPIFRFNVFPKCKSLVEKVVTKEKDILEYNEIDKFMQLAPFQFQLLFEHPYQDIFYQMMRAIITIKIID